MNFMSSKPALQKILKGILQKRNKGKSPGKNKFQEQNR
jgi:hypothetical protein